MPFSERNFGILRQLLNGQCWIRLVQQGFQVLLGHCQRIEVQIVFIINVFIDFWSFLRFVQDVVFGSVFPTLGKYGPNLKIYSYRYDLNSHSSKKSCILLVFIWDYRMITYAIFSRFIHELGKEYYYRKELLICFSNLKTAAYWSSYAGLLYLWTFYSCILRIARTLIKRYIIRHDILNANSVSQSLTKTTKFYK